MSAETTLSEWETCNLNYTTLERNEGTATQFQYPTCASLAWVRPATDTK